MTDLKLIDLCEVDEAELEAIGRERPLPLSLLEMWAIQAYYVRESRLATAVELDLLAQVWHEPEEYKIFRAIVDYTDADGGQQTIHGLFNTYIRSATEKINKTAVRPGDLVVVVRGQMEWVVWAAWAEGLYHDCSAAGFFVAVGQMAAGLGVTAEWLDVERGKTEEWLVLAVPPDKLARLQEICAGREVVVRVVGEFVDNGRFTLHYGDEWVGELDMVFLFDGIPTRRMTAEWHGGRGAEVQKSRGDDTLRTTYYDGDFKETLLKLLAYSDIRVTDDASQSPIVNRQSPIKGYALANGNCPNYSEFDAYKMAWAAIDAGLRQVVVGGVDPEQVALRANFYWDAPDLPNRLGALVRCVQGCYDAALAYGTPFISSQASFNREDDGADGYMHGTVLISALGVVPDRAKRVTKALQQAGDFLFVVGDTRAELGGSHFSLVGETAREGNFNPPEPAFEPLKRLQALHKAIQAGLVQACHDCSEGGIAVAMAEMCMMGGLGVETQVMRIPRDWHASYSADEVILFAESLTRFLVEVRPGDEAAFRAMMGDVPHECVGVVGGAVFRVNGRTGEPLLTATVAELEEAWRGHVE